MFEMITDVKLLMFLFRLILFIFYMGQCLAGNCQEADSSINNYPQFPGKYFSKVESKISSIDKRLSKKSFKYLSKYQRREDKFQKKLKILHPEMVIENGDEKYAQLLHKTKDKTEEVNKIIGGEYSPYLDSLSTSLSFLKQYSGLSDKVKEPLASLNLLQGQLQQSQKIKAFIAERRQQLNESLSKYTKIPKGLKSQYDKLSKTAYYYSAQIKDRRC